MECLRLFYYFAGFNGTCCWAIIWGKGITGRVAKTLTITIPLFVVGFLITFNGFRYMTSDPNVSEEGMELFSPIVRRMRC